MRIQTGSKSVVCNVGTSEGVRKGDATRKAGKSQFPAGQLRIGNRIATLKMPQADEQIIVGSAGLYNSDGSGVFEVGVRVKLAEGGTAERSIGLFASADAAVKAKNEINFPTK